MGSAWSTWAATDPFQSQDMAVIVGTQSSLISTVTAGAILLFWHDETLLTAVPPVTTYGYDFQHGSGTPVAQQNDPIPFCQAARAFADANGFTLVLVGDLNFDLTLYAQFAPLADISVLQFQALQENTPATLDAAIATLVANFRGANPNAKLWLQFYPTMTSTAYTPSLTAAQRNAHLVDGVTIWADSDTVSTDIQWLTDARNSA
jgi:hypothetical protein